MNNRQRRVPLLLDGGTGEELFRRNVPDDRKIWSATALVHPEYHDILEQVHGSFLQSGSNFITTNSYGVVPGVGFNEQEIECYTNQAGMIARQAVTKFMSSTRSDNNFNDREMQQEKVFVLGSLGPLVESYRPDLILPHPEGSKFYRRMCQSLAPHVDAFLGETMSSVAESLQVLDAVASLGPQEQRPLFISYTLDSKGNFRDGKELPIGIREMLDHWKSKYHQAEGKLMLDVDLKLKLENDFVVSAFFFSNPNVLCDYKVSAVLFNCCLPEAITIALERIRSDKDLVALLNESGILLGAYANRLTHIDAGWSLQESESPQSLRQDLDEDQYWTDFVSRWINEHQVQLVGGCCGIRPSHIAHIRNKLRELHQSELLPPSHFYITLSQL
ncbi:vitamin B12-dependent methionine synthase family protein [Nitzschia inconspicua]|uniref:Vitamin B12-dependent methionine synthase family protein n=1 Tax=Nitzschia inconspicua TaxID=303405 RepID=A0A9K3LGJ8_9STRA|nr:vitamin B12-dependent methionine synthase family protein [Nitzschia inconspicua]